MGVRFLLALFRVPETNLLLGIDDVKKTKRARKQKKSQLD